MLDSLCCSCDRELCAFTSGDQLLFDIDGDGTITAEELRKVLVNLGSNLTPEEVELLIKEADYDGNGELDLSEFTAFMMTK